MELRMRLPAINLHNVFLSTTNFLSECVSQNFITLPCNETCCATPVFRKYCTTKEAIVCLINPLKARKPIYVKHVFYEHCLQIIPNQSIESSEDLLRLPPRWNQPFNLNPAYGLKIYNVHAESPADVILQEMRYELTLALLALLKSWETSSWKASDNFQLFLSARLYSVPRILGQYLFFIWSSFLSPAIRLHPSLEAVLPQHHFHKTAWKKKKTLYALHIITVLFIKTFSHLE